MPTDAHLFIGQLLLIMIGARICAELAFRVGIPAVIGEMGAGIVLGPSLLGWVTPSEFVSLLAEIGVILLLFEVGLDTDVTRLVRVGKQATIVAVGGFLGPFLLAYGLCQYVFELSTLVSLFIAGTLTATSIGVTVRALTDVGRQDSPEGQITLGAAVLDDIFGVVLLALLFEFATSGHINWNQTLEVFLYVTAFFFLAPVFANLLSAALCWVDQRPHTPGLIPSGVVGLVLMFAWLANLFGAPELLGGFAAGVALSRRFNLPFGSAFHVNERFSQEVHSEMQPIVRLLSPLFFVSVGLSLDLSLVDWSSSAFWWLSLSLLAIAILGKFLGAMLIRENLHTRVAVGMAMVPRGEVGLIFAGIGYTTGIFDQKTYTSLIMVIAYTTLLSPFWIKLYYGVYGHRVETRRPNT